MTPQERALVSELFDRLASLENAPRDPEAERLIIDGLRRAPNAVYALVQTTLLQDEALRRADQRIRELESAAADPAPQESGGSFLDSMRESLFGRSDPPRRGAVPPAGGRGEAMGVPGGFRQAMAGRGDGPEPQARPGLGGGSFLGTAAASAAGVIGGALLLDSVRSMFGAGPSAQAAAGDGGTAALDTSTLGQQAGVEDVGSRGDAGAGFYDTALYDDADPFDDGGDDSGDFDVGDFA